MSDHCASPNCGGGHTTMTLTTYDAFSSALINHEWSGLEADWRDDPVQERRDKATLADLERDTEGYEFVDVGEAYDGVPEYGGLFGRVADFTLVRRACTI